MKTRISIIIVLLCSFCIPPVCVAQQSDYKLSASQKGIRTSTDVIALAMPVATLTGLIIEKDWEGLKQGAFTAIPTIGLTYLLKYTIKKRRPDGSDNHSFPSMHSADVFANAAFLQRRYGWKIGAPAYILAFYVGWGRIYGKKHDFWDVLTGAVIGVGSALVFTRPISKEYNLTILPFSENHVHGICASIEF